MPDKLALTQCPPPPPPQVQLQSMSASLPILQAMNVSQAVELTRSFSQPNLHTSSFFQQQNLLPAIPSSLVAQLPELSQESAIAPQISGLISERMLPDSEALDRAISALSVNDQAADDERGAMPKRHSARSMTAQGISLPAMIPCGDSKTRSQALRSLYEGFKSQTLDSDSRERVTEFLADLVEFPEMITESDMMLKIADKGAVVALLAANHQHHSTDISTIELFISLTDSTNSMHLLRTAVDQLRQRPDSAVWIKLEGTHLSEAQLRGYGFKNAPDEDYMVLSEALRIQPPPRKMAAPRPQSSVPRELIRAHSRIHRYLVTERQPDIDIYRLDAQQLPYTIDMLNRHKPGLNLAYLANIGEVTQALTSLDTGSERLFLLRSCQAQVPTGTLHHLVLDAHRDDQNRLSLIIMDSVTVDSQELGHRDLTRYLADNHPEASVCFIGTGVQRSPYDCIPFSLDIATKCYQHQTLMQDIHQSMLERNQISGRSGREYRPDESIVLIHPHFAGDILSADFFKHMSSTRLMAEMLSRYPELNETVVNRKGEYLRERQRRLVATHTAVVNGDEKKITYNTSIEHKRLRTQNKLLQP